MIKERVSSGMIAARRRGSRIRRPRTYANADTIRELRARDVPWRTIAKQLGIWNRISTVGSYEDALKPLNKFFGKQRLDVIEIKHVRAYQQYRSAQVNAPTTNRELGAFHLILKEFIATIERLVCQTFGPNLSIMTARIGAP